MIVFIRLEILEFFQLRRQLSDVKEKINKILDANRFLVISLEVQNSIYKEF